MKLAIVSHCGLPLGGAGSCGAREAAIVEKLRVGNWRRSAQLAGRNGPFNQRSSSDDAIGSSEPVSILCAPEHVTHSRESSCSHKAHVG